MTEQAKWREALGLYAHLRLALGVAHVRLPGRCEQGARARRGDLHRSGLHKPCQLKRTPTSTVGSKGSRCP